MDKIKSLLSGTSELRKALAAKPTGIDLPPADYYRPPTPEEIKRHQNLRDNPEPKPYPFKNPKKPVKAKSSIHSMVANLTGETASRPDTLLLQSGNLKYRMQSLLERRKNSALTGQHRVTQRLDKEITLLRASMGLTPMPPEELVRTHVTGKDPTNNTSLEISSYDAEWANKVTIRGLETLRANLAKRGYSYHRSREGNMVKHKWVGYNNGSDTIEVCNINNWWTTSATRNGQRLELFDFDSKSTGNARGIPSMLIASEWDGTFDKTTAQQYALSWSKLLKA